MSRSNSARVPNRGSSSVLDTGQYPWYPLNRLVTSVDGSCQRP